MNFLPCISMTSYQYVKSNITVMLPETKAEPKQISVTWLPQVVKFRTDFCMPTQLPLDIFLSLVVQGFRILPLKSGSMLVAIYRCCRTAFFVDSYIYINVSTSAFSISWAYIHFCCLTGCRSLSNF